MAYYHPDREKSKELSASIVRELNAICPVKSNRAAPVSSGMDQYDGMGYGEIRTPAQYGLIAVLSETDFHDNLRTAEWIISSKDAIAGAYVKALVDTFGISEKGAEQALPAGTAPKYYKVQVGAFSQQSNADYMLKRLKAAGFDGYVKFE